MARLSDQDMSRLDDLLILVDRSVDQTLEMEGLVHRLMEERQHKRATFARDELQTGSEAAATANLNKIAEKVYADRRRLMNDVWTESANGVTREFVGSLHPSHTVRYPR